MIYDKDRNWYVFNGHSKIEYQAGEDNFLIVSKTKDFASAYIHGESFDGVIKEILPIFVTYIRIGRF